MGAPLLISAIALSILHPPLPGPFAPKPFDAVAPRPSQQDTMRTFRLEEDGRLDAQLGPMDGAGRKANASIWQLVDGGTAVLHGDLEVHADGRFSFVPAPDYYGVVTFTYCECASTGRCRTMSARLLVHPVNDAPHAVDDRFTTTVNTFLADADLAANDRDVDDPQLHLAWSLVDGSSAAENGTLDLRSNGRCDFSPNPGFQGTVTFIYQVCDPSGTCAAASASITVAPPGAMVMDLGQALPPPAPAVKMDGHERMHPIAGRAFAQ